jgi:hypothetical protein
LNKIQHLAKYRRKKRKENYRMNFEKLKNTKNNAANIEKSRGLCLDPLAAA